MIKFWRKDSNLRKLAHYLILLFSTLLFLSDNPTDAAIWGTYLGEYKGVAAYSNGSIRNLRTPAVKYGYQYQDTEYVNRFYAKALKWKNMKEVGNAENYYLATKLTGLKSYPNGGSIGPQPDDILAFSGGHLSIITRVGKRSIDVIEQNWNNDNPRRTLRLRVVKGKYRVSSGSSAYKVEGWLRIPSPPLPSPKPKFPPPKRNPLLSISPTSGPAGTKVVVRGWRWESRQDIYLRYQIGRGPGYPPKREYRHLIADNKGSFVDTFVVPSGFAGSNLGILVEFQDKVPERKFQITSR